MMRILVLLFFFVLSLSFSACAQKKIGLEAVLGDWEGKSKCVGSNPNCHDEAVIYHFTRSTKETGKINLSADKLVNGKPESMGDFEMTFDQDKMTLTTEFPIPRTGGKGVWQFQVRGDNIDGTLTIFPENEVGRKVHVERKKRTN